MKRIPAQQNAPLILIADDDKTMRVLARHILQKEGYIVEEAEDGVKALSAYERLQPDLILLDVMMPRMDGFQACTHLRQLPGGEHIPILMITALNDNESVDKAFEVGATDYIIKPIHHAVVRQRVRRLLRAKEAEEALRESEARYRTLFEESPISIWLEDYSEIKKFIDRLQSQGIEDFQAYFETHPDAVQQCLNLSNVIDVNNATLAIYEADNKETLLRNSSRIFIEETHSVFKEQLIAISKGEATFEAETTNQTLTGKTINVLLKWSVARGHEETWSKVIVSVIDITRQRQTEQSLMAAKKLAELGTLAAGTAHEINSPLQVITGMSDNLLQRLAQAEPDLNRFRRGLEIIHRNGWRCAEIVRSLRTYAHASATQIEPNDLNTIIKDLLLLIEHQLKSWSGIDIITHLSPEMPPLACDRNQITQVLINLLTNARDAMPEGGEIIIRSDYDRDLGQHLLQITDTGQGIPEATRMKIFDPFFTTKQVGKGTGLGLSIVAGIVRAHGGKIEVESNPGQGASFTLSFPETDQLTPAAGLLMPEAAGRFDDSIQTIASFDNINGKCEQAGSIEI